MMEAWSRSLLPSNNILWSLTVELIDCKPGLLWSQLSNHICYYNQLIVVCKWLIADSRMHWVQFLLLPWLFTLNSLVKLYQWRQQAEAASSAVVCCYTISVYYYYLLATVIITLRQRTVVPTSNGDLYLDDYSVYICWYYGIYR